MLKVHKFSDHFIGAKLCMDNNVTLSKRNLIVCIDNGNMNSNTFSMYISYIPYIIYDLLTYINYEEMYLIRNYPCLTNIYIDPNNIYRIFNSLKRYNSNIYDAHQMITKCCEGIDIIRQEGNSNPFDIFVITQNKIYNKLWIDALHELVPVASNIIYLFNIKNHEHLDIYDNLKIDYFNLNGINYLPHHILFDIENAILKGIDINNHIKAITFDFKGNYCLTVNNQYQVTKKNENGNCSIKINILPKRTEYIVINSSDHKLTTESLTYCTNDDQQKKKVFSDGANDYDKIIFYKIFLTYALNLNMDELIDKYKNLLTFALNLKPIISDLYSKNIGNEIGYLSVLLNKEYRTLFIDYICYLKDQGSSDQTEYGFMNLIDNFSKIAKFNTSNVRIAERVGNIILENISNRGNEDNTFTILLNESNSERLNISREFFSSMLTLTDWYEEIKSGNSTGILISIESNDLTKIGANGAKPNINNITMTFLPVRDYIEAALESFKKYEENDINNINIVTGDVIGTGNAIIPLYICSEHWEIARQQLKYILGIILVNSPFSFIDSHLNFLFYMLAEMTRQTFKINTSDKWFQTYFAVYRTCAQVAYEKGYHKGIKKLIKNYIDEKDRILNTRPFDNDVLFGQILSTGCLIGTLPLSKFCDRIFENIYWRNIIKSYNSNYFKNQLYNLSDDDIKNELKDIIQYEDNKIIHGIETITYNYKMILLMHQLFTKIGGFTKFLKILDDNYGLATDNITSIKDYIQINLEDIDSKYLYDTIGMDDKYEVMMVEYTLRSLIYQKAKQRRDSIKKNPHIWNVTSNNVVEVLNKYKTLFVQNN